jgi:glyoxylase I family protein
MALHPGPIHHLRMAVTDVQKSVKFYTDVVGFEVVLAEPPPSGTEHADVVADSMQGGVILGHQGMFFGLRPTSPERAGADRFEPFRVGLDHLSFAVPSRADLDEAVRVLDELGVEHGPIRELPPLGLAFLAFFDPDGIALELTAPSA